MIEVNAPDHAPEAQADQRKDSAWQEKVEKALKARQMSQVLRKGKPKSFRASVGRAQFR